MFCCSYSVAHHLKLQGTCSLSDPEASLAVAGLVFVIAFNFSFCYLINLILLVKLVLCP